MTIFEQYSVCSWKVGNLPILKFPVVDITEDGGNRIVIRERPYRDGAKLDDTGSKGKIWRLVVKFENSIEEEGLAPDIPLYPNVLNDLIASADIHETGDLVIPTRGKVRARLDTYSRHEVDTERDLAIVSFTFCEDNEDNIGNQQFEQLKINASARRLGEQTEFSATSEGMWSTSLSDLREFGSKLEAFANFPGDTVADIDNQAGIVIGTTNRVIRAFTRLNDDSRNQLNDPEMSLTQRKLEETKDLAGRSRGDSQQGRPRSVPYFVKTNTDLYNIASDLGQNSEDIISLNPNEDPFFILGGTVVKVLESAS